MKKTFVHTWMIHSIIFMIYASFILNFSNFILGIDEYGIGQVGLFMLCVIFHSFIGVMLSINSTCNQAKSDHQILNEI